MLLKKILRSCLLSTPGCYPFDVLVALYFFWGAHKRIPRRDSGLFNDYLFFLKLSDELYGPLRQLVSDKALVKRFYASLFGQGYAPKTLGQVYSYDSFCKANLPERCVIKPSHLSGVIFYDQKLGGLSESDHAEVKRWFLSNMYRDYSRERNYRYLTPSVLFEELIDDLAEMKDYKVFCVGGVAKAIHVHTGRHSKGEHRMRLYDTKWNALSIKFSKSLGEVEPRPRLLDEMLAKAEVIAKHFSFVRVDFYLSRDSVLIGELTSVPGNAHDWMSSRIDEREFAKLLGIN